MGLGLALLAGAISAQSPSPEPEAPSPSSEPEPEPAAEAPTSDGPPVAYQLKATLDVLEHRVKGEGTITWRNASTEEQREVWLHLYLNAFKNERTVFMRSTATRGFRGGGKPETWGWLRVDALKGQGTDLWAKAEAHSPDDPDDETDIRVPLAEPVPPGGEVTFEVRWTAQLPTVTARTGYLGSFHMVAQWFPKLAKLEPDGTRAHFAFHRLSEFYADYGSYDVTIDVPQGFVVGASGPRVEEQDAGERHVVRHRMDRVHDFAFCAWDQFEVHERQAPTGVAMRALVPRGDGDLAALELDEAAFGLAFLGERFGAYPYEVLTIVHPPPKAREAGGMEYPTLITTGGRWYQPRLGMRNLESVTIHELAHQWFYGLLGSNEHAWPFLDEGLTTWATLWALESRYPDRSGFSGGWLGWTIGHPALVRAGSAKAAGKDAIARSARDFALGSDYGGLVYARTATLLESLRRLYPEKMPVAMKAYADAHRFGHPVPDDLLSAVREHVGERAATAMRRVLFERGTLDVSVASMWSEKA
ncbi:MAG: M1 family metallopeptidase, partial [Polyangiaceae bacterium]